jgi:hypothetical protein
MNAQSAGGEDPSMGILVPCGGGALVDGDSSAARTLNRENKRRLERRRRLAACGAIEYIPASFHDVATVNIVTWLMKRQLCGAILRRCMALHKPNQILYEHPICASNKLEEERGSQKWVAHAAAAAAID